MTTVEPTPHHPRPRVLIALAVLTMAALIGVVPFARLEADTTPATTDRTGWYDIVRESIRIAMDGGWIAQGELSYPRGAARGLPTVILLHSSGLSGQNTEAAQQLRPILLDGNQGGSRLLTGSTEKLY
jgi:hypothetical protein